MADELFHSLPTFEEGKGLLSDLRSKAWNKFKAIGLPSGREASYHGINLSKLLGTPLGENQPFSPQVIGHEKVVTLSFEDACIRYPFLIKDQIESFLSEETSPFVLLPFALQERGMFVYIPAGTHLEKPLSITPSSRLSFFFLVIGKGAEATLSLSYPNQGSFGLIHVIQEEGSSVTWIEKEGEDTSSCSVQTLRAELKRDAKFYSSLFSKGRAVSSFEKKISLNGEGALADLKGLWSLKEASTSTVKIFIDHNAPHTKSSQTFKGALFDTSSSSFFGQILVKENAQKTEAYQLNQNLILSGEARAKSHPHLKVFADDVKASHGATVGGLNSEELFYLKTRGLSESKAKELLINGFFEGILSSVSSTSIREEIKDWIRT